MRILVFVFLMMFTTLARAEMCDDPKTQADMNYCANYHYTRADAELNDVFARLKSKYASIADAKSALIKSQRAWLTFRDAECGLAKVAAGGGSAESMLHFECLTRVVETRVKQLQERLNCQEGQLDCIAPGDSAD